MMKNNHISAVFFDFDNTLVDTIPAVEMALAATFTKFNMEFTEEHRINFTSHSAKDHAPKVFGDFWQEALKIYTENYLEFSKHIKPMEYAEDVLKLLHEHNIPQIIITNKRPHILNKELTHLSWEKYFALCVGSGEAIQDKPSPLPALYAATKLNLKLDHNIWFIGDALTDIICAVKSGCRAILYGKELKENLEPYTANMHFRSHKETLDIFKLLLC